MKRNKIALSLLKRLERKNQNKKISIPKIIKNKKGLNKLLKIKRILSLLALKCHLSLSEKIKIK